MHPKFSCFIKTVHVLNPFYFQRHLSFCKARKINYISPCHTYPETINSKDSLLSNEFQSPCNFEGQHYNYNYLFWITPVHRAPKYRTTKVNCPTYENLMSILMPCSSDAVFPTHGWTSRSPGQLSKIKDSPSSFHLTRISRS